MQDYKYYQILPILKITNKVYLHFKMKNSRSESLRNLQLVTQLIMTKAAIKFRSNSIFHDRIYMLLSFI